MSGQPDAPDIETLSAWLVDRLARDLRLAPARIDVHAHFSAFGLDSVSAVQIAGDLEDLLHRRLPDTLLWEHPSVHALATRLAAPDAEQER